MTAYWPKSIIDAFLVFRLEAFRYRLAPAAYLLGIVVLPMGMLLFAKALAPEGNAVEVRLITGSLVFGLGTTSVNLVAQFILGERFERQLQLIVVSPVHPLSYMAGVVLFSLVQAGVTAAVILSFAPLFDISVNLSLWLLPVLALTGLSLTGLAIVIATWSPGINVGSNLANAIGMMLVLVSPVYFPIETLPDWLAPIARLSPYTHAGRAIHELLTSGNLLVAEVAALLAVTAVTLTFGAIGLRWRETS